MKLRGYQQEARDSTLRLWSEGIRKLLLVLPTGTGKTIVFSKIIEDLVRDGKRVLVLAHRGELLDQAADKLKQATGLGCAVEKAEQSSLDSWFRVVVGSVQSMMREKRLAQFSPDHFDTIIIDEAHHSVSNSYQKVLEYFPNADVLGVTATPDRSDMKNLGEYYDQLAYEYTLPKAIKEGYLSPIKAITLPLKIDLSGVSMSVGDFKPSDIDTALDPYLHQIADEMIEHCSDRKTVVFLPLIATSQKFQAILNEKGFRAGEVNGESKDREQVLKDFENDRYNVLCNSMLLTEGWDCPSVDCVIVLRPTKVRSLYSQMVGRGTRLYPGKKELLLLDFLWHTDRHELCHPAHLIAGNDEVAQKMTEMIEKESEDGSFIDLEYIEEIAASTVQEEREEALAQQLAEMRKRKRREVDPVQWEFSIGASDLTSYVPSFAHEMAPPSDSQLAFLSKNGIHGESVPNSGKASLMIDRIKKRQTEGLSTAKQIRFLEQKGFEHVGQWSFEDASNMVTRISSSGWRVPAGVNPKTYKPEPKKTSDKQVQEYGWN